MRKLIGILIVFMLVVGCDIQNPVEPCDPEIDTVTVIEYIDTTDAIYPEYDLAMNVHVLRMVIDSTQYESTGMNEISLWLEILHPEPVPGMAFLVETKRGQYGFDIVSHLTRVVGYEINLNVPMITFSCPYVPIETPMVWKEGV